MEGKHTGRNLRRKHALLDFSVYIPKNIGALGGMVRSLKRRDFALFELGMFVVLIGTWIQQVATGWLVFRLTNSLTCLSTAVFLSQIPTFFVSPFAGVISDRFNRRKIMLINQTLLMLQIFVLGVLTLTDTVSIEAIYALSLFSGLVLGVDAPARQSLYTKLVPPEDISNAIALNAAALNSARFIGPAIGGVLIGIVGEGWCFIIGAAAFGAILGTLYIIKFDAQVIPKKTGAVSEFIDGFRYLRKSMPIRTLVMSLAVVCFFAFPFPMLLPAFAKDSLGGDSATLGNMMSLIGLGSLGASIYLMARKSALGLGRVITVSVTLAGCALMAIAHVKSAALAYVLCPLIGFGMIATSASTNVMIQSIVDESKRGRIMSFFTMAFFGMPPIGSLIQGYLGEWIPWTWVIFGCGAVCVLDAVLFERKRPEIREQARTILAKKGMLNEGITEGVRSIHP